MIISSIVLCFTFLAIFHNSLLIFPTYQTTYKRLHYYQKQKASTKKRRDKMKKGNKNLMTKIFKLSVFLLVFFSISNVFAQTEWSVHGGALVPVVKDVDNTDPMFGGGVACEVNRFRFTFDVYGSRVKEDLGNLDTQYGDISAEASATELIFSGTVDYLLIKSENSGFFAGVGLGVGYERLNFKVSAEATVGGQTVGYSYPSYNWSEVSALATAVIGIKMENGEIFVRGIFTPQYENVQGAIIVGAGFRF
jgi:hypothetical protein